MKKTIFVILIGIAMVSFIACNSTSTDEANDAIESLDSALNDLEDDMVKEEQVVEDTTVAEEADTAAVEEEVVEEEVE